MGVSPSKGEFPEEQLRRAADRVKDCLHCHQSSVCAVETAIRAQRDSVEMLIQMVSELQQARVYDREKLEKGPLEKAKSLLANIQKTMELQCSSTNETFKILDNCIRDILGDYIPGSGSSVDIEKPKSGSSKFNMPKDAAGTFRYETEGDVYTVGAEGKQDETSNPLAALQAKYKALQRKLKDSEDVRNQLYTENKDKLRENKRLNETISWNTGEFKLLQRKKDENERKLKELSKENETQRAEIRKQNKDANARYSLEHELRQTVDGKKRLQHRVNELERVVSDLENEKRKMKERKVSVPVQLYYQRRDELMSVVVEELSVMLHTHMETKNIQLDIVRCENSSNIQADKPTLVLCINASRLGTDAAAAIEGVHRSGRTALLIFHHKNVHALPNNPSDRMLTSSEFKALGGIFDLAFLSGKGIYPCDKNNIAISGIENFIRQNISG